MDTAKIELTPEEAKVLAYRYKLKLLINKETKKVLFADVRRDFVHFLFRLLDQPIGFVGPSLMGSHPKDKGSPLRRLFLDLESLGATFHTGEKQFRSPECGGPCSWCRREAEEAEAGEEEEEEEEEVEQSDDASPSDARPVVRKKVPISYIVMDDLTVEPSMSAFSAITLLDRFGIRDLSVLEERLVPFGHSEMWLFLAASVASTSTTIFTDMFLEDEVKLEPKSDEVKSEPNSKQKRSLEKKEKCEPTSKSVRRRK